MDRIGSDRFRLYRFGLDLDLGIWLNLALASDLIWFNTRNDDRRVQGEDEDTAGTDGDDESEEDEKKVNFFLCFSLFLSSRNLPSDSSLLSL